MSKIKALLAIIGGSGFYELPGLKNPEVLSVKTPYGDVANITCGEIEGCKIVFLARHGSDHKLPPHKINYRANIWAFKTLGVNKIVALNAVGGIAKDCSPGVFVIPDQIIDYTFGREHTYADVLSTDINHIDFTYPFDLGMRQSIGGTLAENGLEWVNGGVYGCMQGPRLETAAEIRRLKKDGCTIVGMTVMPEASLSRELSMAYVSICTVANWGAGVTDDVISLAEINSVLERSGDQLQKAIQTAVPALTHSLGC